MDEFNGQLYPRARQDELVIQELADEVLVYDLERNKAHCLGHTAAMVWKHCDGQKTIAELAQVTGGELQTPVAEDVVWLALEQLGRARLLQERVARPAAASGSGLTRRQLMGRVGAVAAAAVVTSIIAPTPAEAFSCVPDGGDCTASAQCCSRNCSNGTLKCLPA